MKINAAQVLLLVILVTSSSCVTKRQRGSWQEYPLFPLYYHFSVSDVTVLIDHVREENIAQQIYRIAGTYIESRQNITRYGDNILLLDIIVEQRSFMQNVEMYNSIYVSCIARDADGNIYACENEYISGKNTFISVPEQNIIITRVLKRFLSNQQQRYNDIIKYEKKLAKEI